MTNKRLTNPTEDQEYCRKMLSRWVGGDHHLPNVYECDGGISISVPDHGLSTFDWDMLTHLVLLAHRYCVRIEIASSGPGRIKIIAHRRDPAATSIYKRHPSLGELRNDIDAAIVNWGDL